MKKYLTSALLDNLYHQTEQHIQKAITEWQNISPAVLNKQPSDGGWSAAQCLEHLNIYGRYYIPALEKSLARSKENTTTAPQYFTSGWLGNYFTQLMLPNESGAPKKKMKTPANARPSVDLDSRQVVAEFIDQQEKLLTLLVKAAKCNLNGPRIPITIARFIRLKPGDVFMFLIAHNYRHVLQAERALRKSGQYEAKLIISALQLV